LSVECLSLLLSAMSIQSAIVFGVILGFILFALYISLIAHQPQQQSLTKNGLLDQISLEADHLKESILSRAHLTPDKNKQKPFINDAAKTLESQQHDIKILSLPKEELSILQKTAIQDYESAPLGSRKSKKGEFSSKLMKLTDTDPEVACLRMMKKYDVVPSVSWGTLPAEFQRFSISSSKRVSINLVFF
jgi:hypothetical protein